MNTDLLNTKVISNQRVKGRFYRMSIDVSAGRSVYAPGQFLTVKPFSGYDPLLRRPFGTHSFSPGESVTVLYEIAGRTTERMSVMRQDDPISVLGPLGNGFPQQSIATGVYPVLVAGGRGVAPLKYLAEKFSSLSGFEGGEVFIGGKSSDSIVCEEDFVSLGFGVHVCTEDGSCGKRGMVTEIVSTEVKASDKDRKPVIFACGPNPMLKAVTSLARETGTEGYGSYDEYMACGTGHCFGCVIKTTGGIKRVCKDGPVFRLDEVLW